MLGKGQVLNNDETLKMFKKGNIEKSLNTRVMLLQPFPCKTIKFNREKALVFIHFYLIFLLRFFLKISKLVKVDVNS